MATISSLEIRFASLSLSQSKDPYPRLIALLNTTSPFEHSEATSLLEETIQLKKSVLSRMREIQENRFLEGLDLAGNQQTLIIRSDSPVLLFDSTTIRNAFDFLITPLKIIASSLTSEGEFSLPKKTQEFVMRSCFGHIPMINTPPVAQGGFSQICFGTLNNSGFTLKRAKNTPTDAKLQLENEVLIYTQIAHHPHILKLMAVSSNGLYLESCEKNFWQFLTDPNLQLSPKDVTNYFLQIAKGLEVLHNSGVSHQDLKPENLLVTEDNNKTVIKICDFGFAADDQTVRQKRKYTITYAPPSKLKSEPDKRFPVKSSDDCWAFGVMLYECISGGLHPLCANEEITSMKNKITKSMITILRNQTVNPPKDKKEEENRRIHFSTRQMINAYEIDFYNFKTTSVKKIIENLALQLTYEFAAADYTNTPSYEQYLSKTLETNEKAQSIDPSGFFKSIILRCLDPNDTTRITIQEIVRLLENPPQDY